MLQITNPGLSGPLPKELGVYIKSYAAMGNEASLEDGLGHCPDPLLDGSGNIEDCILCVPFLGTEDRGTEHSS